MIKLSHLLPNDPIGNPVFLILACMLTPDLPWEGWCSCLRLPTCQGKPQTGVPFHYCYRCQRSPDSSRFSWCEISILCHAIFDGEIFKLIQQDFQGVKFQSCVTLMSSSEASSSFGAFTDDAPSKFFPPIGTYMNMFNKTQGTHNLGFETFRPTSISSGSSNSESDISDPSSESSKSSSSANFFFRPPPWKDVVAI